MIYLIVLFMTVLGAIAGLFLKKASGGNGFLEFAKNKFFYLGTFIYFIAAILNIYVLKYLPYSVVLPLTAITYIWTMIFAHFTLKEIITNKKIVGVTLIILGAFCVAI